MRTATKLNIYTCNTCGGRIVTVDLVEGTTPFMVGCRVTEHDAKLRANEDGLAIEELRGLWDTLKCKGDMYSSFYRVPPDAPEPTWEWYKPDAKEYAKLPLVTRRDHVDKGGLLLRRIKP